MECRIKYSGNWSPRLHWQATTGSHSRATDTEPCYDNSGTVCQRQVRLRPDMSMGWVDPWVGLGWVSSPLTHCIRDHGLSRSMGWVGYLGWVSSPLTHCIRDHGLGRSMGLVGLSLFPVNTLYTWSWVGSILGLGWVESLPHQHSVYVHCLLETTELIRCGCRALIVNLTVNWWQFCSVVTFWCLFCVMW